MRGKDEQQLDVFSYISPEQRVPHDHPLRALRVMTDEALRELQPRFNKLYAKTGRPSIAPEKLLRALLLQALYSVRSERLLMEQLDYNLLFRWFVGLNMDDTIWDVTVFTKNRERLLDGDIAEAFFQAVLQQARERSLLSDEHFTVDGTLIEAWASEKSYQPRPGPPPAKGQGSGSGGEVLKADTHGSITDPDARMYRKGLKTGWKLQHMAHAVSENQHGLVVATAVSHCSPKAERQVAITMLRRLKRTMKVRVVAADKGYHERDFVDAMAEMGVAAHVPHYKRRRRCLVDPQLYDQPEYGASQRKRKWIERFFSWLKNTASLRKTRHRGHPKLDWNFTLAAAAYNLVRIATLTAKT
jgi:transposase